MPDVTTTSPTTTSATSDTYSIRSRSSPPPTTTPCARERSMIAPAAALRSIEQLHLRRARARHDDPADDAGRRDHRHVGPQAVARALVDRHASGSRASAPAPMISAAVVFSSSGRAARAAARARARGRPARAAPAAAICAAASSRFSASFSGLSVPQADVAAPDAPDARDAAGHRALHFGEDAEGDRLEHRHAASSSSPARRSAGRAPASRRGTGSRSADGYRARPRGHPPEGSAS